MLDQSPTFTARDARAIAREHFGIDGDLSPLPSERDQNWLLVTTDHRRYVLKLANATETRALLEAQQQAMAACHANPVSAIAPLVPRVVRAFNGDSVVSVIGPDGKAHLA